MAWPVPVGVWKQRKRILVVEHSPATSSLITTILRAFNYEMQAVGTGQEALTAIQSQRPDLVLLDTLLPDTDGSIICRHLKADPATWDIPIVCLTSKGDTTAVDGEALRAADGYLTKPVSQWQLINRVEHILKRP